MFKLRAVIHCPGFLHGTSCTCLAAVSLAIYQCDGAKPRQCGIRPVSYTHLATLLQQALDITVNVADVFFYSWNILLTNQMFQRFT